jgi:hypothetical protein
LHQPDDSFCTIVGIFVAATPPRLKKEACLPLLFGVSFGLLQAVSPLD